jgi:hypothetical protein
MVRRTAVNIDAKSIGNSVTTGVDNSSRSFLPPTRDADELPVENLVNLYTTDTFFDIHQKWDTVRSF